MFDISHVVCFHVCMASGYGSKPAKYWCGCAVRQGMWIDEYSDIKVHAAAILHVDLAIFIVSDTVEGDTSWWVELLEQPPISLCMIGSNSPVREPLISEMARTTVSVGWLLCLDFSVHALGFRPGSGHGPRCNAEWILCTMRSYNGYVYIGHHTCTPQLRDRWG